MWELSGLGGSCTQLGCYGLSGKVGVTQPSSRVRLSRVFHKITSPIPQVPQLPGMANVGTIMTVSGSHDL